MIQPTRFKSSLGQFVALGVLVASSTASADVIVAATVTPQGGLFHYEYSVTNELPSPGVDVLLVDVIVLPSDVTLTNLFAPTGFQTIYDSGLGIVTFLPGAEGFDLFGVGLTVSGFGFDSAHAPAASTFEALTDAAEFLSGPTLAPVGDTSTVIPEPATLTLLLAGLGSLAAVKGREFKRRN